MANVLSDGRNWKSTELKGNDADRFRAYLRDMHISFETSSAGYGYTHFECLVSPSEMANANEYLLSL